MKAAFAVTATALAFGNPAFADSRIDAYCGNGHLNEAVSGNDVVANPDGYYIRSLKTQVSHGDPRIIQSNESNFWLCTTDAATPDMEATQVLSLMNEHRVKFLFVPIDCPKQIPNS